MSAGLLCDGRVAIVTGAVNTTSGAGLLGSVGQGAYSFDAIAPENVAPFVAWLASAESRDVTGRAARKPYGA